MDATFFQRLFFPTRPVEVVIPDYADLLQRPQDVLSGREIPIGPAPRYRLAVLVCLFAPVVPFAVLRTWDWQWAGIAWGVGLALALLFLVGPGATSLVLREDGVEFRERRRVVRCPWALFNAPGNPFWGEMGEMILPVSTSAVPYVELLEHGIVLAQGAQVRRGTVRFPSGDRVVLTGSYEIESTVLGGLLLHLGRTLGTKPLEGWAPPEAFPAEAPAGAGATADGWISLRLTNLSFPPACCGCGQTPDKTLPVIAHGANHHLIALLSLGHVHAGYLAMSLPVCKACLQDNRRRGWRLRCWSVAAGLLFAVLVSFSLYPVLDEVGRVAIFIPACIFGPLLGFGLGEILVDRRCSPVTGARYSKRRNNVRLRFRNQDYAALLARHLAQT
jgi:hypothetical protein